MPARDAPVELVPHDPAWRASFECERELIREVAGRWLVGPIEHVGSTAVPGLLAKPVVDIMAGVEDLISSRAAIGALAGLRYWYAPYGADEMHWFCKPDAARRTHHLHLVPYLSTAWQEKLAFRDSLRKDPALAERYAALKIELAQRYRFDREAYTDQKGPFIRAALEDALMRGLMR